VAKRLAVSRSRTPSTRTGPARDRATAPLSEPGVSPALSLVDHVADVLERTGERPSWDEYFMATALLIASRSACGRLHVGCVLVSGGEHSNRIVAAGYNGFLPGTAHRSRMRDGHEQATVHAEQNAIADAARRGVSVAGATAYVSHFPCINCAKILAAAGVQTIKYHVDYSNDPLVLDVLADAGVTIARY
jgi:dCMP deaminase